MKIIKCTLFFIAIGTMFSCNPQDKKAKAEGKSDAYWEALKNHADFNDHEIKGIKEIYRVHENNMKKVQLIDGKKDMDKVRALNKEKVTALVRHLGDFPEYRKIKAFDKEWKKSNNDKKAAKTEKKAKKAQKQIKRDSLKTIKLKQDSLNVEGMSDELEELSN